MIPSRVSSPLAVDFQRSPDYEDAIKQVMEEGSKLGISSFTDTYQSELMWAHYAGNYAGILRRYSAQRLLNALSEDYTVVLVGYGDEPPEITASGPIPPPRKMLSYKKFSWAYEREWRVLGSPGAAQIDEHCIETVYLRLRIDEDYRTGYSMRCVDVESKYGKWK